MPGRRSSDEADRPAVRRAAGAGDFAEARRLFREYSESLDFSLRFQAFEEELGALERLYAPPANCLLLASCGGAIAGCVALRAFAPGICEMKRLFVLPAFRGRRLGRLLTEAIIAEARSAGYATMRLDTVPSMAAAVALYRSLGFAEIAAYYHNPIPGAMYMELDLRERRPLR